MSGKKWFTADRLSGAPNREWVVIQQDGPLVATMYGEMEEQEANARLVAAAPTLLERVRARLADCRCIEDAPPGANFDQHACADCINDRAAIAKAVKP